VNSGIVPMVFTGQFARFSVVAVTLKKTREIRMPALGYMQRHAAPISADGPPTRHYLRFIIGDRPGILEALCGVCARHNINIDAVIQEPHTDKRNLPFVITLEPAPGHVVARAVKEMESFDFLREPPLHLVFAD